MGAQGPIIKMTLEKCEKFGSCWNAYKRLFDGIGMNGSCGQLCLKKNESKVPFHCYRTYEDEVAEIFLKAYKK